jgi:hypothetical protein
MRINLPFYTSPTVYEELFDYFDNLIMELKNILYLIIIVYEKPLLFVAKNMARICF